MNNLREIFDKNKTIISVEGFDKKFDFISFDQFQQAIADYEKSKWKTGFPDLIEGKDFSDNVLAEVEGYTDPQVMCLCWIASENDGESGYAWANCYGKIDGECEFDDNYNVIRWTEIPTTPKP